MPDLLFSEIGKSAFLLSECHRLQCLRECIRCAFDAFACVCNHAHSQYRAILVWFVDLLLSTKPFASEMVPFLEYLHISKTECTWRHSKTGNSRSFAKWNADSETMLCFSRFCAALILVWNFSFSCATAFKSKSIFFSSLSGELYVNGFDCVPV